MARLARVFGRIFRRRASQSLARVGEQQIALRAVKKPPRNRAAQTKTEFRRVAFVADKIERLRDAAREAQTNRVRSRTRAESRRAEIMFYAERQARSIDRRM